MSVKESSTLKQDGIFKTALKAAAIVGRQIAFHTIVGTLASWLLLFGIFLQADGMDRLVFLVGCLLFSIGFPTLYFIVGQKTGIQKALSYLYEGNQHFLFDYLSIQFFKSQRASASAHAVQRTMNDYKPSLIEYLKTLKGIPRLLKPIARHFIHRTGLPDRLNQLAHLDDTPLDAPQLSHLLKELVGAKVGEALETPSFNLFWKILLLEVIVFAAAILSGHWIR